MNSIQEVQNFIDESIDMLDGRQIFLKLKSNPEVPAGEREMLACEMICMFSLTHRHGRMPSYEEWTDTYYTYLVDRARSASHDKLIAKYNYILFHGDPRFKSQEQTKAAIDAYLRIIKSEKYDVWSDGSNDEWSYVNMLYNLINLSCQIKNYGGEEIKSIVQNLLNGKLSEDKDFQYVLISTLLEFPKLFRVDDLQGMEEILEEIVQIHWKEQDFFGTTRIIETGLLLARRLKASEKKWQEMLGWNYEQFAEFRKDDKTGLVPLMLINKAMVAYNDAGNKKKLDELGARYTQLSGNLRLSAVKISMFEGKEEEMNKKLNLQVQIMLDSGPDNIYAYLKYQIVLPDEDLLNHIHSNAGNVFKPFDALGLFSFAAFDLNKNIKAQPQSDDERRQDSYRQSYIQLDRVMLSPLLDLLFYKGIESNILTAEGLIDDLGRSWIGTSLEDIDSAGESHKYSWLELLRPSFQIFFHEIAVWIQTSEYKPQIIPALDSLVLKFEGMIRDLAWAIDENTKKVTRNNAMQEKTLEELLHLPGLTTSFKPEDILFFRFVYTSFGLNLRNNIGHGFFRAYHYSPRFGYLIILSILRLARYEVSQADEEPEEDTSG